MIDAHFITVMDSLGWQLEGDDRSMFVRKPEVVSDDQVDWSRRPDGLDLEKELEQQDVVVAERPGRC